MAYHMGNIFAPSGAKPLGTQEGSPTMGGSPVAAKVAARRWALQNAKNPEEPMEPPPFVKLRAANSEIFNNWRAQAAGSVVFQENFMTPGMDDPGSAMASGEEKPKPSTEASA